MLGIAEVPDIPEALGMLMLPDALAESGIFTLLDEDGALDPDRLEDNDVIFLTSGISGMLTGTSLDTDIIDISEATPFFRVRERVGDDTPPIEPARSIETPSSARNIISRLLKVDDVPLAGSRDDIMS